MGYIVGLVPSSLGAQPPCDRSVHPWVLSAERGQRINITLYDLDVVDGVLPAAAAAGKAADGGTCKQYGWLEDSAASVEGLVPLCGAYDTRVNSVYWSKGHVVKIWTLNDERTKDTNRFLVRYSGRRMNFCNTSIRPLD